MRNSILTVENICKQYSDKVGYRINLLNEINLQILEKEFVTILAPVGSGKSSLLKIIAQLDQPTSGKISEINIKSPFIPSDPSSFPWLSVYENIKFNSDLSEEEILEIIREVGLNGYEDHFPNNKSEGFRFRISLGRALANNPDLIIIDEPFNRLNSETRKENYQLLRMIHQIKEIPIVFGTTNISEAIFFSNRIYLMKKQPGEVIDEINIDLPANRDISIFESEEFIKIRAKIESIFKEKTDQLFYNFSI